MSLNNDYLKSMSKITITVLVIITIAVFISSLIIRLLENAQNNIKNTGFEVGIGLVDLSWLILLLGSLILLLLHLAHFKEWPWSKKAP